MERRLGAVFLCVVALSTCEASARAAATLDQSDRMTGRNEDAIRDLIDGFVKAIRARSVDGVLSVFAPDVVSFDIGPPLQH